MDRRLYFHLRRKGCWHCTTTTFNSGRISAKLVAAGVWRIMQIQNIFTDEKIFWNPKIPKKVKSIASNLWITRYHAEQSPFSLEILHAKYIFNSYFWALRYEWAMKNLAQYSSLNRVLVLSIICKEILHRNSITYTFLRNDNKQNVISNKINRRLITKHTSFCIIQYTQY